VGVQEGRDAAKQHGNADDDDDDDGHGFNDSRGGGNRVQREFECGKAAVLHPESVQIAHKDVRVGILQPQRQWRPQ